MKTTLFFLCSFLCLGALAQDPLIDVYYLQRFGIKSVRKWAVKYENGVKKDSSLYEFDYDSSGSVVAEKWDFSKDLKSYCQEKNGEIIDQDEKLVIWYNPPDNLLQRPFTFSLINEYGLQKTKSIYNRLGHIQTIYGWHDKDQKVKGKRRKVKIKSRREFYYGQLDKDSCSNIYFTQVDIYRLKRGSKKAKTINWPEYRCGFSETWPFIERVEWVEEGKVVFALRYEYL